ncbi:MAG: 1-(5-phosphoribosyl)-5-[(5-phosphoribosylamino)methylideneamino]imidazole-4-carboxamide isomerase [Elusimicrobiota bacterium]|nr:1-(5-phosphoribosyl)-5-[(5-phosphoribosylamino)methylideneamino]imidazole-4-carboxamide isomerase [Elusimicrobiota bacterium]
MLIIPAIDLRRGKAVRLFKGRPEEEKVYFDDPATVAESFARQGAKRIHIVNLDGAFGEDDFLNRTAIRNIRKAASAVMEVGGGIRNFAQAREYISAGVDRIIIGSLYFDNIQDFGEIVSRLPGKVMISADVGEGRVRIHGWKDSSPLTLKEFLTALRTRNIREVVVTQIERDGTLEGINADFYSELASMTDVDIIASGGVSCMEDIAALSKTGVAGVITGKAIYENKLDLQEAIRKYGVN